MKTAQTNDKFGFGCSRVVYAGTGEPSKPTLMPDEEPAVLMVGRTLDWMNPIPTDIYVYPAGVSKTSMNDGPMYKWTSKYGSVMAVSYDGGATEGMNSEGLVMNGLFCRGSQYPAAATGSTTPVMSLAVIVSFFIDQFTTVKEVYNWFKTNTFGINGASFDSGTAATIHFGLTDRTGDNLVIEFYNGEVNLYHGKNLTVLTNEPAFSVHESIQQYWDAIDGQTFLPGSHSSNDRFVRGTYYINHVPKNLTQQEAYGTIASIMGVVAVPFLFEVDGKSISSTQWRSIADLVNNRYYFRFADSYADFWIDLNQMDLKPGAPIMKLDCSDHWRYAGCANDEMSEAAPFTPMW